MTRYSVQSRIFVKGYGFLSFAKNLGKNIDKNISKSLSGKYSQKILDHAKKSAIDVLKTSLKTVIQKTAEGTGDLNGRKITNKIMGASKSLETVTNENDQEISKERYMSPEKRPKFIDDLRLK